MHFSTFILKQPSYYFKEFERGNSRSCILLSCNNFILRILSSNTCIIKGNHYCTLPSKPILSVGGTGIINGKKAHVIPETSISQPSASLFILVQRVLWGNLWFTTLKCCHLISTYSLRHKIALAFADKATRGAVPHCSKEGQDIRIQQEYHWKPPKYFRYDSKEEKKWREVQKKLPLELQVPSKKGPSVQLEKY